jgi:hypothetical protein
MLLALLALWSPPLTTRRAGPSGHSSNVPKDGGGQVSCDTDYWLIAAARLRCLKNHEGAPMGPSGLAILTPILRVHDFATRRFFVMAV